MREARIQHVQDALRSQSLSGLLVTNPTNIYYLTGFSGLVPTEREVTVLVTPDTAYIFVPLMYKETFELLPKSTSITPVYLTERDALITEPAQHFGDGKIGFESDNLVFAEYARVHDLAKNELVPVENLILTQRIAKDEEEIALVRKAVEITDQTFAAILTEIKIGMTEEAIATRIAALMKEFGGEGQSFDSIVAFGEHASLPHYMTGQTKIGRGILLIDMGAKYKGYCADLTRTIYIGEPDKLFAERYQLVLEAEQAAIKKLGPGVKTQDVWQASVDVLGDQTPYFIHGLGHSIGLVDHEPPFLRNGSPDSLAPGGLVTIEPGLYYPGWGGIRIEDYCLITEKGYEVLSASNRELISIVG